MSDEASPIRILVDKTSRIRQETIDPINSGETAGFAVLHLMQKTQQDIPPHDIVELYKQIKGDATVSDELFAKFGAATGECMARGCLYLAAIWKAAWAAGDGNSHLRDLGTVDTDALTKLYANPLELESKHLDTIDTVQGTGVKLQPSGSAKRKRRSSTASKR